MIRAFLQLGYLLYTFPSYEEPEDEARVPQKENSEYDGYSSEEWTFWKAWASVKQKAIGYIYHEKDEYPVYVLPDQLPGNRCENCPLSHS